MGFILLGHWIVGDSTVYTFGLRNVTLLNRRKFCIFLVEILKPKPFGVNACPCRTLKLFP